MIKDSGKKDLQILPESHLHNKHELKEGWGFIQICDCNLHLNII